MRAKSWRIWPDLAQSYQILAHPVKFRQSCLAVMLPNLANSLQIFSLAKSRQAMSNIGTGQILPDFATWYSCRILRNLAKSPHILPNRRTCHILANLAKSAQIVSNLRKSWHIFPNLAKYCQISSNLTDLVRSCQILPNLVEYCQILPLVKSCHIFQISRNLCKYSERHPNSSCGILPNLAKLRQNAKSPQIAPNLAKR